MSQKNIYQAVHELIVVIAKDDKRLILKEEAGGVKGGMNGKYRLQLAAFPAQQLESI